jgi:hypothetical protein
MPSQTARYAAPPRIVPALLKRFNPLRKPRSAIVLALFILAFWPGQTGDVTRGLMRDAYVGVSVFVVATLMLVYGSERVFNVNLGDFLRRRKRMQIPVAALLGMSPGCAGAIIVTSAYSSGNVTLGALVAALTGTMGDAAFLLIATKPLTAAVLMPLSLVAGIITGLIVDRFHKTHIPGRANATCEIAARIGRIRHRDRLFAAIAIPGLGLGLLDAFQVALPPHLALTGTIIALAGMALVLLVWLVSPMQAISHPDDPALVRATEETAFITIWVLVAYLGYGYLEAFSGLDLGALFSTVAVAMPLIGMLIGFIPGCGPQILVTTMYINGIVPFSALIANAVSNDGDALFPAIALNPKAALLATIYTSFPALVLGYGFYFLAPVFLN